MTPASNRNTRAGQVYNDLRNIARAHRRDPALAKCVTLAVSRGPRGPFRENSAPPCGRTNAQRQDRMF